MFISPCVLESFTVKNKPIITSKANNPLTLRKGVLSKDIISEFRLFYTHFRRRDRDRDSLSHENSEDRTVKLILIFLCSLRYLYHIAIGKWMILCFRFIIVVADITFLKSKILMKFFTNCIATESRFNLIKRLANNLERSLLDPYWMRLVFLRIRLVLFINCLRRGSLFGGQGCHYLYTLNKFPVEVVANLLPDLVVRNQAVTGLQQRKEHLVLIQVQ